MKQYLELLSNIRTNGVEKSSGREGMPPVIGLTHGTIFMDMRDGLPLLTTKQMFYKGIIHELLWYISGSTNISYLVKNKCNFWTDNAYKFYLKKHAIFNGSAQPLSLEGFVHRIENDDIRGYIPGFLLGDLGPVYGKQWRNKEGVDQLKVVYDSLVNNPYERYKLLDLWSPYERPMMALPPCLVLYQFLAEPCGDTNYLDLNLYQRSADVFLGVPFDIASMSIFLHIMAKAANMIPRYAFWIGGHCDIYTAHTDVVDIQLSRTPKTLPQLNIKKELKSYNDILSLTIDDFEIVGYTSDTKLTAELFV